MIFDILFIVFIGLGFYWGFRNGIIYSVFSVIGFFLGIIAALKFSYLAVNLLHGFLNTDPKTLVIISFVLVFALVALLFKLVAWVLEQILKTFSLNLPNQIIGGLIHSLMGLYVLCVFIWFANQLDVFPKKQKETSHVYPHIANLGPKVVEGTGKVIPFFRDSFSDFEDLFGE